MQVRIASLISSGSWWSAWFGCICFCKNEIHR